MSLVKLILAMRDGMKCDYSISSQRIKVEVKGISGEVDNNLSGIACEIAREYITRRFYKVKASNGEYLRPTLITSNLLDEAEERVNKAEGNPNYIYWCIAKVDKFCLEGSENEIVNLNLLPIFSLDLLRVKAGEIKDNAFEIKMILGTRFRKANDEVVAENYKKYQRFLSEEEYRLNASIYAGDNNDDDYYDNDDDEGNIMRGLGSGNGDQFGF